MRVEVVLHDDNNTRIKYGDLVEIYTKDWDRYEGVAHNILNDRIILLDNPAIFYEDIEEIKKIILK